MTNADRVKDLCRQLRGIALNYPDGLAAIRAQLDALQPARVAPTPVPASLPVLGGPAVVPQPIAPAVVNVVPVKRGPGRPRKVQA